MSTIDLKMPVCGKCITNVPVDDTHPVAWKVQCDHECFPTAKGFSDTTHDGDITPATWRKNVNEEEFIDHTCGRAEGVECDLCPPAWRQRKNST